MLPGARVSFWLAQAWSSARHPVSILLLPLGWLVQVLTGLKRYLYAQGLRRSFHAGVPTIVVGNIIVGGGGKSPLVLELAERLRARGRQPAILARGYGGSAVATPREARRDSLVAEVGDEAVMLARSTLVPVVVCADRVAAARFAAQLGADVLVSDDGLQHYRLQRDAEIVVVDGQYGFGNQRCLPAGPLRESMSRLETVDLVVHKNPEHGERGYTLEPTALCKLDGSVSKAPAALRHEASAAVAGIGQPESFFRTLEQLGYAIERHAFPDHYAFVAGDFAGFSGRQVITTAKDAVRIDKHWCNNVWFLQTRARLNPAAHASVDALLDRVLQ